MSQSVNYSGEEDGLGATPLRNSHYKSAFGKVSPIASSPHHRHAVWYAILSFRLTAYIVIVVI